MASLLQSLRVGVVRVRERSPPARFFLLGLFSLTLLIVNLVLVANETATTLSTALGVIGALGMFACAWLIKRRQSP
jgi:uncharacterized membrane protein YqjE